MWLRTSLLSLSIFATIAVGSHQALAETEAAVRFGERMKGCDRRPEHLLQVGTGQLLCKSHSREGTISHVRFGP